MTTYYVDSIHGSDSNNGSSEGSAFASLAKISALNLKAGDTVLLSRGSTFDDSLVLTKSGKEGAPITISAYGEGENPVFSGPMGIHGSKTAYITISNVSFVGTDANAIYAGGAKHWVIDNVVVKDTGTVSGIGGIVMKNAADITITNSKFDGAASDAVYIDGITNLVIDNNSVVNLKGRTADGFQVNDSHNVVISNNMIDQSDTVSLKGGIMMERGENIVITGNTVLGGSFGLGINGTHVLIDGNSLIGQNSSGWSSAILVSGEENVSDYTVTNNVIQDSNFGVSLTGLRAWTVTRNDITITDNVFTDIANAAIKVDQKSTGTFHDNVLIDTASLSLIRNGGLLGGYDVSNNQMMTQAEADVLNGVVPTPEPQIPDHTPVAEAPLPAPEPVVEHTPPVATPEPEPTAPVTEPVVVEDHVPAPAPEAAPVTPVVTPTPAPVVQDQAPTPTPTPTPEPVVSVPTPAPVVQEQAPTPAPEPVVQAPAPVVKPGKAAAPVANIDRMSVDMMGTILTGNVLSNDVGSDNMAVRSFAGAKIGAEGLVLDTKFGTLHIEASGQFKYILDSDALSKLDGLSGSAAMDKFTYKVGDTGGQDSAQLIIDLNAYAHHADHLVI